MVTTIAGLPGIAGLKDGVGSHAWFNQPRDLVLDGSGNLYVADTGNAAIRKIVLSSGLVTTLTITTGSASGGSDGGGSTGGGSTGGGSTGGATTGGGSSSSSGGGGGAMGLGFLGALLALASLRRMTVR